MMRLRIKIDNCITKKVNVDENENVGALRTKIERSLISLQCDFSLNKKDVINENISFIDLGLVSGDTIYVLQNLNNDENENNVLCKNRTLITTNYPSFPVRNDTITTKSHDINTFIGISNDTERSFYNFYPKLLHESTLLIPDSLIILASVNDIKTHHESICLLSHLLMLEMQFSVKDLNIEDSQVHNVAADWKKSGCYVVSYHYKLSFPENIYKEIDLLMTPIDDQLIIHGIVKDNPDAIFTSIKVNQVIANVNSEVNLCFKNLQKFSSKFKDSIILPTLTHLYESEGDVYAYSLLGLPFDIKFQILKYLKLTDLVQCCYVCHTIRQVAKDSYLWRKLYSYTFNISDTELLKNEYGKFVYFPDSQSSTGNSFNSDWFNIFKNKFLTIKSQKKQKKSEMADKITDNEFWAMEGQ